MDASWLCALVSVAIFIAVVLLAVTCLDCRNKNPLASIRETASEEYVSPSSFIVIHPYAAQPVTDLTSIRLPSNHLSPSPNPAQWRPRPHPPSEIESTPSYENPGIESEPLESDADDAGSGYIIVLPEGQPSTPSSDVPHDYENVSPPGSRAESENDDYQNVTPLPCKESDLHWHLASIGPSVPMSVPMSPISDSDSNNDSDNDDDDEDDDDDESGNYVNQQPMIFR
ncbi:WASH complex subunit CCDC53 homolog isoform X2 [Stegastes partitus]|uniref:WASH complex subunit CCDC53 homolog isoform X2 n=1 Tax=Stegastes partitus TaxID=144197 RepID=A0A9Y4NCP8_9TELE|nr:PREDICTED: WASH complex subunit CCDC53 homolog isoform X2 [Stegastes partitus]